MQIKTTMRYHFTSEWLLSKSLQAINAGEGVEKREPSYPTLCHPIDWSTPGFPVPYYLPEFAQTHVNPYAATFKIKSLSTKKKNRKQLYCFV